MKKIILLFLVTMSLNVVAQKALKEGVMTMKMNMSSDNEQVNAQLAMMGDMAMTTYFKGNKSRAEMKNPMAGETTTIIDLDSKKMLALINNPMLGKKYTKTDVKTSPEDDQKVKVTANGKTKTIVGYVCKGYDIQGSNQGVNINMTMYVTDKIKAPTQNSSMLGDKLEGFPMHMTMNMVQGGMPMKITMEVTEVKGDKVADSQFAMTIPEGYEKMEQPKPAQID